MLTMLGVGFLIYCAWLLRNWWVEEQEKFRKENPEEFDN